MKSRNSWLEWTSLTLMAVPLRAAVSLKEKTICGAWLKVTSETCVEFGLTSNLAMRSRMRLIAVFQYRVSIGPETSRTKANSRSFAHTRKLLPVYSTGIQVQIQIAFIEKLKFNDSKKLHECLVQHRAISINIKYICNVFLHDSSHRNRFLRIFWCANYKCSSS